MCATQDVSAHLLERCFVQVSYDYPKLLLCQVVKEENAARALGKEQGEGDIFARLHPGSRIAIPCLPFAAQDIKARLNTAPEEAGSSQEDSSNGGCSAQQLSPAFICVLMHYSCPALCPCQQVMANYAKCCQHAFLYVISGHAAHKTCVKTCKLLPPTIASSPEIICNEPFTEWQMVTGDAGVDRDSQASCYPPDSQEESAPLGNSSARFSAIVLDNRQEASERAVHECCVFIVPQVSPQFPRGKIFM